MGFIMNAKDLRLLKEYLATGLTPEQVRIMLKEVRAFCAEACGSWAPPVPFDFDEPEPERS